MGGSLCIRSTGVPTISYPWLLTVIFPTDFPTDDFPIWISWPQCKELKFRMLILLSNVNWYFNTFSLSLALFSKLSFLIKCPFFSSISSFCHECPEKYNRKRALYSRCVFYFVGNIPVSTPMLHSIWVSSHGYLKQSSNRKTFEIMWI